MKKQNAPSIRKTHRPPKEAWLVMTTGRVWIGFYGTKRAAQRHAGADDEVLGPYRLAQQTKSSKRRNNP